MFNERNKSPLSRSSIKIRLKDTSPKPKSKSKSKMAHCHKIKRRNSCGRKRHGECGGGIVWIQPYTTVTRAVCAPPPCYSYSGGFNGY